jgi:voltage-gated potassium channel
MHIVEAYLRLVSRWRWSLLLAILIGTFLIQPLWPVTAFGELANFALAMLIFGGAIYAGRTKPWAARGVVALLVLALLLQVLSFLGVGGLDGILTGLALVIVVAAMVATFAELVGSRESTPDGLIGAIFGYFLIAAAWALLYRQLEVWHAGSFRFAEGGDRDIQLLYFSLITITTVGYGDILPATPVARVWAALEAAVGTLYIAILIGRIVGELRFGAVSSRSVIPPEAPRTGRNPRPPGSRPGS